MTENKLRWWQRLARRIAFTRIGAWLFARTLHHLDRMLLNVSDGGLSTPRILGRVPVVRLTTIGAKTGKERTVPVLGLREGEWWLLVASNWGRDHHPAWYHNLQVNPEVTLTHRNGTAGYVARDATAEERDQYWHRIKEEYPGFELYQERSGSRQIPLVVLEPHES